MAATCENFERIVLNWMLKSIKEGRRISYASISDLVQKLGFSTSINETGMSIWKESNSTGSASCEKDLTSEDLLNVIIQALNTNKIEEPLENELPVTKESLAAPLSPTMKSPKVFSPSKDPDISVQLPTSSPINQNSIVASKLLKIISLAKETYSMTATGNASFGKAPFSHRRLSDIRVSPLAELDTASNELNLTKRIEAPSKVTPKRAIIVKPDVKNETYSAKKSLLQPVKSKLQSFQSKLKTPTSARSISTSTITRSAGHSRLPAPKADRRLSSTPNGALKPPGSVSRFSYSQFKRIVK